MKIGFIGVGHMGGPMCRNIIKAGHDVIVYDLSDKAVQACTDIGATKAGSAKEAASGVEVVMTSLPMPADVEQVALGPGGIAEGAAAGTIYIDLTTNSPSMAKSVAGRLESKGIHMIDAPVSGGVFGAEKGSLSIMVGGDKAIFDKCMPLFEDFGENITHVGELGTGCIAKIINNLLAFCNMAAAAEGLMLGTKAGIDPDVLNQCIRTSSGNSFGFRGVAKKTLSGDWSPTFTIDLAYKDLHLALEMADELGVPMALGPQTHNLMRMAKGLGFGGDDASAMMRVYESTLRTEVRGKGK